jgi:CubicO group peptidase (beta-lactamase class C family)
MKRFPCTRAGFLLASLAVCFVHPPDAPAKPSTSDPAELASRVEEYMAARIARNRFSGSILIARDGKVLVSRAYGMANLEHGVPNTPETKFRLGSITKQFTAMSVLILEKQGKLAVTDKVKRFLPDAPKAWDEITIRHLLTHTSGIPNYTESLEFLKTLRVRVTLKELIGKFKDRPLDFKPGEKFHYSNSGYIVLGQIIENASGQNYASFLKSAILDPLQMHDTGYDNATAILRHRASGYTRRIGLVLTNCDYIDMSIPHAAGALYSTTLDLLKWDQALYTEKLVPRKSIEAMFTPFKDNYGYGWLIDSKFSLKRYEHGGGIMGFVTIIERFPEEKLLVVALSNLENSPVGEVGTDLAAIALGRRYVVPREPKVAKLDSARYDACAGRYKVEPPGKKIETIVVSHVGSRLLFQHHGKTSYELTPESESLFYVKAIDSEVKFESDGNGKVTSLILIEDGRDLTASRVADEPKK